jgi:lysophospholipase L1-like esterase
VRPDFIHLLLTCSSVLLTLGLGELLVRALPLPNVRLLSAFKNPPLESWYDPDWANPGSEAYRRHPSLGYEHARDIEMLVPLAEHARGAFRFRTNNIGLRRDSSTSVLKPPDLFRVLVLGDSQTDGYVDNDETFSSRLESILISQKIAVGKRLEVLNAGIVGYSPAQEFLWYKVRGSELKPDLVLMIFYVGNDIVELRDPSKPSVDLATGRAIRPSEGGGNHQAGPGRFASKSPLEALHLVGLARYAVQVGPLAELWRKLGLPGSLTEVGGFQMDTLIKILRTCHGCFWQNLRQTAYARRNPKDFWEDVRTLGTLFSRLHWDIQADGGHLVIAVLPTRAQVEPARASREFSAVAALLGLTENDRILDNEIARAVHDQLSSAGIPVISLQEPLGEAARTGQLYYGRDWHLNTLGHQAVAFSLQQELAKRELLHRTDIAKHRLGVR